MCVHSNSTSAAFHGVALAFAILFCACNATAQSRVTVGSAATVSPFAELVGSWSGSGTIDLSNDRHEPIKCRASYDVLEDQKKLQLNIHCASESYNFDLRSSADLRQRRDHGQLERVSPAMLPEPYPVKWKELAFRLWPTDHHLPPI